MKARCTGCSLSAPTPSTVVMVLPAAAFAGIRQLTTGNPVDEDGAGPANAGPAHELGSGQTKPIPQNVDEQRVRVIGKPRLAAVDQGACHGWLLKG